MKIAIASRGLIRSPSDFEIDSPGTSSAVDWCLYNYNVLKNTFMSHGLDVEGYFCSWNTAKSAEMCGMMAHENTILLRQEYEEKARSVLKNVPVLYRNEQHPYYNRFMTVYGTFLQSKALMDSIRAKDDCDYICITRHDLRIQLSNLDSWLTDKYEVPAMAFVYFNDNFAIAKKEIMLKVWSENFETINEIIDDSYDTEEIVANILKKHNLDFHKNDNISQYLLKGWDFMASYKENEHVIDRNSVNGYRIIKK